MKIKKIEHDFSICRISDASVIDLTDEFCFFGKTDEELSLVCTTDSVPRNTIACSHGWKAFRIDETLDFSLIGILSRISSVLADKGIGIFAVSTYNTDYVFTKKGEFENALSALAAESYDII